jgi:hypothetical protein
MARSHLKTRRQGSDAEQLEFLRHLAKLGLTSAEAYQTWCVERGFSRRINKTQHERRRERDAAVRRAARKNGARKPAVRHTSVDRKPDEVIAAIFSGDTPDPLPGKPIFRALDELRRSPDETTATKRAARRLFLHLSRHAELPSTERGIRHLGRRAGNTDFEAVVALARHAEDWIRTPEWWIPSPGELHHRFGSLARHLFAAWPVPSFLDTAWFAGNTEEGERRQLWFLHVGRGENIRHADLPVQLTKKAAHHFLEAPCDLSVEAAIRWGQIRALGGDPELARAPAGTRLEFNFDHDEFWQSVFRWFIVHPELDPADFGPITDYIRHRKFEPAPALPGGGPGDPPQPHFSMKGRSPTTLLAEVDAWHVRLGKNPTHGATAAWPATGIAAFRLIEGSTEEGRLRIWTIDELTSAAALDREGRVMHHCVGSYAEWCTTGRCCVWTMTVVENGVSRKVLTINVDRHSRMILEARGPCNARPDGESRAIVRRWAAEAGLAATYV